MTRHLNDTSVTDICELGGDFATMRGVHYEVKCWNPLIKSTTSGKGLVGQWWQCGVGGPPLRVWKHAGQGVDGGVVGSKERGRQVDGPLDHSTGKGWVKEHAYGKGWVKTDTGWKWMGAQYYETRSGSRKP